jgi:hypothetical protein
VVVEPDVDDVLALDVDEISDSNAAISFFNFEIILSEPSSDELLVMMELDDNSDFNCSNRVIKIEWLALPTVETFYISFSPLIRMNHVRTI